MSFSPGDLVLTPQKRSPGHLALGRVAGEYRYRPDLKPFATHTMKVDWLAEDVPREALGPLDRWLRFRPVTVSKVPVEPAEIQDIIRG